MKLNNEEGMVILKSIPKNEDQKLREKSEIQS